MIIDKSKKIGICSPSWSGPGVYPHVFNYGVAKIKEIFEMDVVISENATQKEFVSFKDRANDINNLFKNEEVGFICASIGGDDSVGTLKYLDLQLIKNNPKPFMGFSDTTTLLMYLKDKCNTPTLHGPSIMSGFAEPSGLDIGMIKNIEELLFTNNKEYIYEDPKLYTDENNNWDNEDYFLKSLPKMQPYEGWQVSNPGIINGKIYGGSLETLKRMKDAKVFNSDLSLWSNNVLFLETSEEKPSIGFIINELRDYHERGILKVLKGILFGQLSYYSKDDKKLFYQKIKTLLLDELGYKDLLIVQNLNFGHIRPQWLLPIGYEVHIDTQKHIFKVEL